jgi:hypothetical protein
VEEKKSEKKEIPILANVEVDSRMQEAQGPDKEPKVDIQMEDSSWTSSVPLPPRPTTTPLIELQFPPKSHLPLKIQKTARCKYVNKVQIV